MAPILLQKLLEHPAYSPDLAPSDYFLFGLLKKELKGKRFDSDEDVQKVVQDFFHTLPKSAYKEGIYKLPERWRRCIESQGVVNPTPPIEQFLAQRGFWERGDELQYATLEHPTHALLDSGPEIWLANPSFEYSHSGDIH
ncbi:hypothetical protein LAZ67_7000903 [Cordylochernes scorpioides]|uniref:Histone-lysine N-methyltransferase SETMAR n=1 Tax=Cordylochernes scorpioides TaxID=51811 RepID=A0ABY6KLV1_9ARAC|nr:hypothetical protein LAZ67_7000903 [Cordylochernes scorpioides]